MPLCSCILPTSFCAIYFSKSFWILNFRCRRNVSCKPNQCSRGTDRCIFLADFFFSESWEDPNIHEGERRGRDGIRRLQLEQTWEAKMAQTRVHAVGLCRPMMMKYIAWTAVVRWHARGRAVPNSHISRWDRRLPSPPKCGQRCVTI